MVSTKSACEATLVPRREVEQAVKSCVKTYKDSRLLCREVDMCALCAVCCVTNKRESCCITTPQAQQEKEKCKKQEQARYFGEEQEKPRYL